MTRKLVTVRTVSEIIPIEGADAIELAKIDGWQCVVKKGEFKAGDHGIYFEVDSFLPAQDTRFSFLANKFVKWNGKEGARIKTIRLRGQLSQGLLLPLKAFPEVSENPAILDAAFTEGISERVEDIDCSELLGVEKWERALHPSLQGRARGNFPSFIPKTDEERVQNLKRTLDNYWGEEFEVTIKLDGSSCTIYYLAPGSPYLEGENLEIERFGVCSRNLDLVETEGNAFWEVARKLNVLDKLRKAYSVTGLSYAVQGELVGPSIQGNYERVDENNFFVFKVFCIDEQRELLPLERRVFCSALGLEMVPIVDTDLCLEEVCERSIDKILEMAEGPGIMPGVKREGLVFKHTRTPFSFKAISNSYLLAEK
jgi:RNA ligase (TIGR02306 family)